MAIGPVVTRGYGLTALPSSIANVVKRGYTVAQEGVTNNIAQNIWYSIATNIMFDIPPNLRSL